MTQPDAPRIVAEHAPLAVQDVKRASLSDKAPANTASAPSRKFRRWLRKPSVSYSNEDKNRRAAEGHRESAKACVERRETVRWAPTRDRGKKRTRSGLLRRIEAVRRRPPALSPLSMGRRRRRIWQQQQRSNGGEMAADELHPTPLVVAQAPAAAAIWYFDPTSHAEAMRGGNAETSKATRSGPC